MLSGIKSVPTMGYLEFEKLDDTMLEGLKALIQACWHETVGCRPTAYQARQIFDHILPDEHM